MQALDFFLQVFAASVVAWADHATPLLLGVHGSWIPCNNEATLTPGCLANQSLDIVTVHECLTALPLSLQLLLAKEPWKEHTQKVLLPVTQSDNNLFYLLLFIVILLHCIVIMWNLSKPIFVSEMLKTVPLF